MIIGILTLTFIKRASFLGQECFHTDKDFLPTTTCLNPAIYYGLLGLAALLVIVGIITMLKSPASRSRE